MDLNLMVNQRELLSQGVDIYFNHCGAGSIYESLYYAIPGIYIPQHFDQFMNGETLAKLGCGLIYNESPEISAYQKIDERVNTLLANFETYRENVLVQQRKICESGTVDDVIEKIEYLMNEKREKLYCRFERIAETLGPDYPYEWLDFSRLGFSAQVLTIVLLLGMMISILLKFLT